MNEGPIEPEMSVTECQSVLRDVWVFLDNEMDPERRAVVERHLADCPPCLDETDVGDRLKSLLHRKCGGDQAPQVLRERLIAALTLQATGIESR
jgi:mycothiol system anti-sigma-R factor